MKCCGLDSKIYGHPNYPEKTELMIYMKTSTRTVKGTGLVKTNNDYFCGWRGSMHAVPGVAQGTSQPTSYLNVSGKYQHHPHPTEEECEPRSWESAHHHRAPPGRGRI